MVFTSIFLCFSAVLVQTITAQCIGNPAALAGNGFGLNNGLFTAPGMGCGLNGLNAVGNGLNAIGNGLNANALSNGGGFVVTSTSPIAPTGISVLAENLAIEGPLEVGGQLPLLATVALEGAVPTGGQAGANYGCGNGNIGIVNEIGASGGLNGLGSAGLNAAGIGLNAAGLNGLGASGIGLNAGLGAAGLGLGNGLGCSRIL